MGDVIVVIFEELLMIVYEDDNWLVVNKLVGVVLVFGFYVVNGMILNWVKGYLVVKDVLDLCFYLIICLDCDMVGLLLVVKYNVVFSMISF